MPRLATCTVCGAPHPGRGRCPTCRPKGRDDRSPTTRAQTAEYEAERAALHLEEQPPCHWCGNPATTADHVVPVALGGRHHGNLVPACSRCNSQRQADPAWRPAA